MKILSTIMLFLLISCSHQNEGNTIKTLSRSHEILSVLKGSWVDGDIVKLTNSFQSMFKINKINDFQFLFGDEENPSLIVKINKDQKIESVFYILGNDNNKISHQELDKIFPTSGCEIKKISSKSTHEIIDSVVVYCKSENYSYGYRDLNSGSNVEYILFDKREKSHLIEDHFIW